MSLTGCCSRWSHFVFICGVVVVVVVVVFWSFNVERLRNKLPFSDWSVWEKKVKRNTRGRGGHLSIQVKAFFHTTPTHTTPAFSHTHTHTHAHTLPNGLALSKHSLAILTNASRLSHTHSHTHTHTHTHIHTHTHSHPHSHGHAVFFYLPLPLSRRSMLRTQVSFFLIYFFSLSHFLHNLFGKTISESFPI